MASSSNRGLYWAIILRAVVQPADLITFQQLNQNEIDALFHQINCSLSSLERELLKNNMSFYGINNTNLRRSYKE
jgi:hypothetical protein